MAGDSEEEEDHAYGGAKDGFRSDASNSGESDSEDEAKDIRKRTREEQLDLDEVEALKKDLGDDARMGKRIKAMSQDVKGGEEILSNGDAPSKESEEVWKSLQKQEMMTSSASEKKEELILVKKQYRFAGEEVKEEKLLPASHPDAIAYLAKLKTKPAVDLNSAADASKMGAAASTVRPSLAPLGPRKKKSSLAAMSAAATGKPVKLNTLEKSKMDWNKFKEQTADEREREEMEAQTKGGSSGLGSMKGYMERKNFLDRVQDRLGEQR